MTRAGARAIVLFRLPVMDALREGRLDFYRVSRREPGRDGVRPKGTHQHMVEKWLGETEGQIQKNKAAVCLP